MKTKCLILLLIIVNTKTFAIQTADSVFTTKVVDSLFFKLKRDIIKMVSNNIDTTADFQISKKNLYLEFSDYRKDIHIVGEGILNVVSTTGISNRYKDSICINNKNAKGDYILACDRSYFDSSSISSLGYPMICGKKNYAYNFYKVINDPISGWRDLEFAFFLREWYHLPDLHQTIELIFPIYIYRSGKLMAIYMAVVEVTNPKVITIKNTKLRRAFLCEEENPEWRRNDKLPLKN